MARSASRIEGDNHTKESKNPCTHVVSIAIRWPDNNLFAFNKAPCSFPVLHRPRPGRPPGFGNATIPEVQPGPTGATHATRARLGLTGFFLSGLLMSFLGAVLPAWGHHLQSDYSHIALYFVSLNAGLLASIPLARMRSSRRSISFELATACTLGFASLLLLSLSNSAPWFWRLAGFAGMGAAAGLINTGVFRAMSPLYKLNPAATVNLAGVFFGAGCLSTALLIAGAFNVYTVSSMLFLLAVIPGLGAIIFSRSHLPAYEDLRSRSFREAVNDFRSPSAVLFSLLLFVQFGNEWSIAGWLPLFLIQRLGISPASSLLLLALYWLALIVGRLIVQGMLPHVHHGKILLASVASALFGCVVFTFTDNRFGAGIGVLLVGLGFAPVYPLVVEKIGARFPYYHPGFFNGIFSLALTGGFLTPTLLGFVIDSWGIQVAMLVPMAGTFFVFVLLLIIWLEAKLAPEVLGQPAERRL